MGEAVQSDLRERKCTQNQAAAALLEFYHCVGNEEWNNNNAIQHEVKRKVKRKIHREAETRPLVLKGSLL